VLTPFVNTAAEQTIRLQYGAISLVNCPQIPSPVYHGWSLDGNSLVIDWMSGEPAPKAVLELLSCQCKKNCQIPSCPCMSNGLKCTELCKLQECSNWRDEVIEMIDQDNDSDDEDESIC